MMVTKTSIDLLDESIARTSNQLFDESAIATSLSGATSPFEQQLADGCRVVWCQCIHCTVVAIITAFCCGAARTFTYNNGYRQCDWRWHQQDSWLHLMTLIPVQDQIFIDCHINLALGWLFDVLMVMIDANAIKISAFPAVDCWMSSKILLWHKREHTCAPLCGAQGGAQRTGGLGVGTWGCSPPFFLSLCGTTH